jgi:hypothetical protein
VSSGVALSPPTLRHSSPLSSSLTHASTYCTQIRHCRYQYG